MDEAVADRNYDEAIAVETDDEVSTPPSSEAGSHPGSPEASHATKNTANTAAPRQTGPPTVVKRSGGDSDEESSSSEATSSSEGSGPGNAAKARGNMTVDAYNPDDFKGMKVSSDVEDLFQYITRYKPHTIDLDTTLRPFIPELIPSIGEVDASLKMPRPDGKSSELGLAKLDEPSLNPSDPSILDLQLRSLSKNQDLQPMEVRSIENAEKCPKEVENWVRRIDDLNRSKPAPVVQYSRRMPDVEQLMQVWPAEFEEYLQSNPLPDLAELDLDLPDYIRLVASICDVPVHNQLTESLHVIFTLYSEFKSNQHFSKTDNTGNFGPNDPYSFGVMPSFATGHPGESMAPSRAPSPVGRQSMGSM